MQEILAVIPARGGSRSIPRKNLALVGDSPLVCWTIKAALNAKSITRTVVSTDDEEIAAVSRAAGAEVPFSRPAQYAGAESPTVDAIRHCIDWLHDNEEYAPEYLVVLQPTSPLRLSADIDRAVALARSTNADGVASVSLSHHHPFWTLFVGEGGELRSFPFSDTSYARRQDLPPAFALNGALYVVRTTAFRATHAIVPVGAVAYVMTDERSLDINTSWELHLADLVLRDQHRRLP